MRLEEYLNESKKSDAHEKGLAKVFLNGYLPDKLPKWMVDYGFIPGAKVTESKQTGGSGIKPDVIAKFDNGPSLRISAKMSNADFFGNWYSKDKVIQDLGVELVRPIGKATVEFAESFKGRENDDTFVGVSVAFGKRSGKTGIPFTNLFPIHLIKSVVAGNNSSSEVNANCLYTTTSIPNTIEKLLDNIQPISDSVIKKLSENFCLIFRPVYTNTGWSNSSAASWAVLEPKVALNKPTYYDSQDDLMTVTYWKVADDKSRNVKEVVKNLKKSNILVSNKDTDLDIEWSNA